MAKIQAVWAIDIGLAALKALKLTPDEDPEKLLAEAFDYVEYPKILSQPDADPEELVREALTTFLGRNEVAGTPVAIGVSGQAGLVKFIKLPPVDKKRIPDIVKFEARQQIPFALEEVVWDYQPIGGEAEDGEEFSMAEVGLFAMKRDQINRAIVPLKNAGIEVDVVQMGPLALYNFVAFDNPPPPSEGDEPAGSYVLLDIGADNTDLIITDGTRIWQRNVPIGGNHFTRALTKELKLTFAKAEHLKRNATKAPDPRAVFTAMRGIFNDFSSEVSRSIGFYSSVNRQAKIVKIIGLGNGFKLPGLQKFLQQNVNHDVERLDHFERLSGEEVVDAPQFQENLPSFAVAYGLAVQGLGLGPLRTNLLPPEIKQERMIRRKKPWALVAATLMMVGFSALYFSVWNAYAKTKPFEGPVGQAKSAAEQGQNLENQFNTAKSGFEAKKAEGQSLVGESAEEMGWPLLVQQIMGALPNPTKKYDLDPNKPSNVGLLGMLRVHVDKIVPVWREDLKTGWFDKVEKEYKQTMHAYDQANPPSGAGWVVQIYGHHYNPPKLGNKQKLSEEEKKFARGPLGYIRYVVLPRFYNPQLRLAYGLHHAAMTWYFNDQSWTTAKGTTGVPPAPPLAKAEPPKAATDATGGPGMEGDTGAMAAESGGMMGSEMPDPSMMGQGMMDPGMGMMGPGMMGMRKNAKSEDIKTLSRTDFKLELVWQPPKAADQPKTPEESRAKFEELKKAMTAAAGKSKGSVRIDEKSLESALAKLSVEQSADAVKKASEELQQKVGDEAAASPDSAPAGQAPSAAPNPPGTAPVTPGAPAPAPAPATAPPPG